MDTSWTDEQCRLATQAAEKKRLRTALGHLTAVLSVYPDHEKALGTAATILYYGMSKSRNQTAEEPLTFGDLLDTRLDRLFCSCDWQGCSSNWVSVSALGYENYSLSNPVGGRCKSCAAYACRKHLAIAEDGRTYRCQRCGGDLDFAPPPNGRAPRQMERLNQPLVHLAVLREGPLPPSRDFVRIMLDTQTPDALEDKARVKAYAVPDWSDDPQGLATALLARDSPEYLGGGYEFRSAEGYDQSGVRWAVVKVFKKEPKHVDPSV